MCSFNETLYRFIKENSLECQIGPPLCRDSDNQPYITFAQGYETAEGARISCVFCENSEEMWNHYFSNLLKWLDGRKHITWRTVPAPEIVYEYKDPHWGRTDYFWAVYSRLTAYE